MTTLSVVGQGEGEGLRIFMHVSAGHRRISAIRCYSQKTPQPPVLNSIIARLILLSSPIVNEQFHKLLLLRRNDPEFRLAELHGGYRLDQAPSLPVQQFLALLLNSDDHQ